MTRVALASVKASPGVTTTALALGATWPAGRSVVLVEADPAGGDITARYGLPGEPNLLTLAAAARRTTEAASEPTMVAGHLQHLPGGLAVLAGPACAEQAAAALRRLGPTASTAVGGAGSDVLVDCGRLDTGSPALEVAAGCEVLLVCVRPVLAELHHLAARVESLRNLADRLGVVLLGPGPYPPDEVAQALDVEILAALPEDHRAAALLAGQPGPARGMGRLPLLRAARSLAESLRRQPEAHSEPPAAAAKAPPRRESPVLYEAEPVAASGPAVLAAPAGPR